MNVNITLIYLLTLFVKLIVDLKPLKGFLIVFSFRTLMFWPLNLYILLKNLEGMNLIQFIFFNWPETFLHHLTLHNQTLLLICSFHVE